MQAEVESKQNELRAICEQLLIKRLYIFGSAVNATGFNEDSDIDFLIAFEDSLTPEEYSENYFQLHYKLRELFNREIDVLTERSLSNPYFIKSIERSKYLVYER
jgi:DNA phosphorothioation-dependent restriction protein DptG